jgi:hypothetical protein
MSASEVIAGGEPEVSSLVRQVRLAGSRRDTGQELADVAWANPRPRPQAGADPTSTRTRRAWRRMHWHGSQKHTASVHRR